MFDSKPISRTPYTAYVPPCFQQSLPKIFILNFINSNAAKGFLGENMTFNFCRLVSLKLIKIQKRSFFVLFLFLYFESFFVLFYFYFFILNLFVLISCSLCSGFFSRLIVKLAYYRTFTIDHLFVSGCFAYSSSQKAVNQINKIK